MCEYILVSFCNIRALTASPLLCLQIPEKSDNEISWAPVSLGYSDLIVSATGLACSEDKVFVLFVSRWNVFYVSVLRKNDLSFVYCQELPDVKDGHSILVIGEHLYVVSTGTDQVLCYNIKEKSLENPRVIWAASATGIDTHHINSIVEKDGDILVSAFGQKSGQLWATASKGYIYNITKNLEFADGIYHPHSLSVNNGKIYYSDSHRNSFCVVGEQDAIINLNGYTRGIAWLSNNLVCLASSIGRRISKSTGLISNSADPGEAVGECGTLLLDIQNKEIIRKIDLSWFGPEIYDVLVLHGLKEELINLSNSSQRSEYQAVQILSNELVSYHQQVQSFTVQVSELEQQVQGLVAQVSEREQQVQGLVAQVSEREQQVQGLVAQVSEREQQVQGLVAQVSEREQQVRALSEQMRAIMVSKFWQLACFFQQVYIFLMPLVRLPARVAHQTLSFYRNLQEKLKLGEEIQEEIKQKQQEQQTRISIEHQSQNSIKQDKAIKVSYSTIGIVIVSYNASTAVRVTLASLRRSKNKIPTKVILIDNASFDFEREKIRNAFDRHVREASLSWEYMQLDKNLGFSGGNNIGIKHFLDDPNITHICLLNSDVIVPDYWLDWLVESNCDIVSPVTNKADSEQCIPIDFSILLEESLDEKTESIPMAVLSHVTSFANDWHTAWQGNLIEGEATFFCVLVSKSVFQNLGFLDENFFPGGYEDDDYCIRARQFGYSIYLARDVFIYHWGSASFGQLQYEYFTNHALNNLQYLERKHGITRHRRPQSPFVSFKFDMAFAATRQSDNLLYNRFFALYFSQLSAILEHFEYEFNNLSQMIARSELSIPVELITQIKQAQRFDDLLDNWKLIVSDAKEIFMRNIQAKSQIYAGDVIASLEYLIEGVKERVMCNFAMHAFLFSPKSVSDQLTSSSSGQKLNKLSISRLFWLLKTSIPLLSGIKGIVFFGGYPYQERQSDGYFQRIQIIDRLFADCWRVYVETDELPGRNKWYDRPQSKVLVLRVAGDRRSRMMAYTLALFAVLRSRKIYFHSVLRMHDYHFGWLMHLPGLSKLIDLHGVVPEEFRFHNDYYSALTYDSEERLAVRKCNMVVVVTHAMENYLRQKYRDELRGKVVIFPMFSEMQPSFAQRPYIDGKPVIVYAGGLHKWQQVPKMIDAITRTIASCIYRFYCPDPDQVMAMLPDHIRPAVVVSHKTQDELITLYNECHYGFILREDNIVNHVACPTKLVEYLAMGIIPILDAENIGDFNTMGMQFVTLKDLLIGCLPDEEMRAEMARINLGIIKHLRETYISGSIAIQSLFSCSSKK